MICFISKGTWYKWPLPLTPYPLPYHYPQVFYWWHSLSRLCQKSRTGYKAFATKGCCYEKFCVGCVLRTMSLWPHRARRPGLPTVYRLDFIGHPWPPCWTTLNQLLPDLWVMLRLIWGGAGTAGTYGRKDLRKWCPGRDFPLTSADYITKKTISMSE